MLRLRTPWIFRLGAGIYDVLTSQEVWQRHCRDMARLVPGPRVLDLGIGPGVSGIEMARAVPGTRWYGLDDSKAMIARAKHRIAAAGVTLPLVRADAGRLPFRAATYDGATGHSFLYLLRDADAVLREIRRILRPGGGLAFLEPNELATGARLRAVRNAYGRGRRFGTSMLLWSVFSALHGRYTARSLAQQLVRCGYVAVSVAPAFDGLGLVATARRP